MASASRRLVFAPLASEDLDVYGKAGYYFFDQEVVVDDVVVGSNSPSGLLLGAGSRFAVSDQFAVRAEADWFDINDGDLWSLNLGFEYLFGRPAKAAGAGGRRRGAGRGCCAPAAAAAG